MSERKIQVQPQHKAKTLDGRKTRVQDLNTSTPEVFKKAQQGIWGKIAAAYRNLNQVMAGMYTGTGCSGTPHEHHSYHEQNTPAVHSSHSDTAGK